MFVRRTGEKPGDPSQKAPAVRDEHYRDMSTPAAVSGKNLINKVKKPGRSIIDAGVVITGTVACTGELEVLGQIQGDLHCQTLTVTQPGHIRGDVFSDSANIDGRVDGTIRGKQVILRSGAHVTGDIHHASLVIEHGAIFEGKVRRSNNPTQVQPAAPQAPVAQAVAPRPAVQPTPLGQNAPLAPRSEPAQPAADGSSEADPAPWPRQPLYSQ